MELQTAKGVRDIPPEEKALKNQVVNTLTQVFELYGFAPLETPILERYETLAAKFAAGEASDALKETFTLTDQGDRKLGLRFDLTVPLARFMAMNPMLKMPFKRYEVGQVFRDGPIKLGRYREFWQCDIDTIGSNSMLADAEIVAVIDAAFKKLELDIIIKINNRKVLNGILEQAGIADTKEKEQAIIAIDKLDKIEKEGVAKELQERGFSKKQIDNIFTLVKENISLTELKKKLTNAEGLAGIQELEELFSYLKSMNISTAQFDVSLARGLAYYTGSVFEARLKKGQISSSVAGGGRWDNMIGGFMGGGREVPAVGVAFGLEPIMDTLRLEKKIKNKSVAQVYVIPINTISESLKTVQELRENGIAANFCLGKKGVSKNLEYASSLGIPYALIIGEDELKQKKVLLRDMNDGTEQLLTVKEVIKKLHG
ncbi:MAG: histidine--tRNA ligase, partial [Nanoarchaeota archaeon]|nr:histidine--tRNA ligase [Nanoarchaeota archaeon]